MTWLSSRKERYLRYLLKELQKAGHIWSFKKGLLASIISSFLIIMFLVLSSSGIGIFYRIGAGNLPLVISNYKSIPKSVIDDASGLAEKLYGRSREADLFKNQLLASYEASSGKDVIILFNSGGWGLTFLNQTPDWESIIEGIQADLHKAGYRVLALNYQRTSNSLFGRLNELKEITTGYLSKARDLSYRVEFLTRHYPNLKVILAGESTGTMICDSTMNYMKENSRVFSIQTGVPFWHVNTIKERTLVLKENGFVADAFSQGKVLVIFTSSVKSYLGLGEHPDSGTILGFLSSPGHEYWWQDPGVRGPIERFLAENIDIRFKYSY